MKEPTIKIGTKLTLLFKIPGVEPEEYYCKVIDINEDYLIIDYPVHKQTGKTKFFQIGASFKADFVGDDEAFYQFQATVAARVKVIVPALALSKPKPEDMERIQRRQFVRVDATADVAVHRQNEDGEAFTTVTSDVSGGGLSLIVPREGLLKMNEMINVWLVLGFRSGKFHYIETAAQVVFLQMRNGIHTASLKFVALKPKEQQLIISYCFEKQREMRKKELS